MSQEDQPSGFQASADPSGAEGLARIEQVASRTGLTKRTLRYYEEMGLLDPPTRTEGGYRLYTAADVQRLERIKRLKDLLGLSLSEIRELVQAEEEREQVRSAWQRDTDACARLAHLDEAEALVRRQLRPVEDKLSGLQEMRDALRGRLARFEQLRAELRGQVQAGGNGSHVSDPADVSSSPTDADGSEPGSA
jgi:MerR family transcriptional regulator, repressor of the yfmOP operon